MKINKILTFFFLVNIFWLCSCGNDPKVISPVSQSASETEDQSSNNAEKNNEGQVHEVVVQDVLQAEKYTYLYVNEADRSYWMAVGKMEAEKGEKYFYTGGLLKKNFYSRDFDRNFETIYLVSRITPAANNTSNSGSALSEALNKMGNSEYKEVNVNVPEGAIALKELIENPSKYSGQSVTVKGQCVKLNSNIMNRNWVHLQDGSMLNGNKVDLTVTTDVMVPVGAVVTMTGKVATNQDFGAGYRYDLILEEATLVQE